jgi:dihydropteroate synthase
MAFVFMRKIYSWKLSHCELALGRRTAVMGILNVTPDSFSDGGRFLDPGKAAKRAVELEALGADILDIGGESSRPGSTAIPEDEELRRVIPVLEALKGRLRIPISVDTYRSGVAREALAAGAQAVNDISAFRFDPRMAEVVREYRAGCVLMHSRGGREELHLQPPMVDAVAEVLQGLEQAIAAAEAAGIRRSSIAVDPGIGFGKRAEESLKVLSRVDRFARLECALLVGTSRKSFIRKVVPGSASLDLLWGTAATVASAVLHGAHIVRVHDVREIRMLVDVLDVVNDSGNPS